MEKAQDKPVRAMNDLDAFMENFFKVKNESKEGNIKPVKYVFKSDFK